MPQLKKFSGPARVIRVPWRQAAAVTAGAVLAVAAVLAVPAGAVSIPAPELAFTPSSYDYGQVPVGQTPPASQDFTLENQGNAGSGSLTLTLSGPGSAAFTITASTCDKSAWDRAGRARSPCSSRPPAPPATPPR